MADEDKKKKKHNSKLTDAAKKLGHAGGLKGGPARSKKLSAKERSDIARQGGLAHDSKAGTQGKKKAEGEEKKRRGEKDKE